MWFQTPTDPPDWSEAEKHLKRVDPIMREAIERVGPCMLFPRRNYFLALCKSIYAQQVSTTVANVLFTRFCGLFPRKRPTPEALLEMSDQHLLPAGLSRQKRSYIRDLAEKFASGEVPTRRFPRMSDQEIIDALTSVKGIGRWTAEMFLIFVMNRPDVWPIDDLGVRKVAGHLYGLGRVAKPKELVHLADPWRPWRTIGTWYLWRWGGLDEEEKKLQRTAKPATTAAGRGRRGR